MTIADIMTRPVRCLRPTDTLDRAAHCMRDDAIGAVPVADADGRLVGILTDRDIVVRGLTAGGDVCGRAIGEILSPALVAIGAGEDLDAAVRLMEQYQVRRLPVVDADRRPVGIVTLADLARHAGRALSSAVLARVSEPAPAALENPANR